MLAANGGPVLLVLARLRIRPAVLGALVLIGVILLTATSLPLAVAAQTPTPEVQGYRGGSQAQAYRGAFADLATEIDEFWASTFLSVEIAYESPSIVVVEIPTPS